MNLILSLGSNQGEKEKYLLQALEQLEGYFKLLEKSKIYQSKAVDYLNQPDFLNQVLHFKVDSKTSKLEILQIILGIEKQLGRKRDIPKGPRTIDIDILFLDFQVYNSKDLTIPHPRLFERSFIVYPLKELQFYDALSVEFSFPDSFCNEAFALK